MTEDQAWQAAQHEDTADSYERYVDAWPEGPAAAVAAERAAVRLRQLLLRSMGDKVLRQRYLRRRTVKLEQQDRRRAGLAKPLLGLLMIAGMGVAFAFWAFLIFLTIQAVKSAIGQEGNSHLSLSFSLEYLQYVLADQGWAGWILSGALIGMPIGAILNLFAHRKDQIGEGPAHLVKGMWGGAVAGAILGALRAACGGWLLASLLVGFAGSITGTILFLVESRNSDSVGPSIGPLPFSAYLLSSDLARKLYIN
jgi:hypothetical protein